MGRHCKETNQDFKMHLRNITSMWLSRCFVGCREFQGNSDCGICWVVQHMGGDFIMTLWSFLHCLSAEGIMLAAARRSQPLRRSYKSARCQAKEGWSPRKDDDDELKPTSHSISAFNRSKISNGIKSHCFQIQNQQILFLPFSCKQITYR